jgi:hypothetical protein
VIPLPDVVVTALREYRKHQDDDRAKAGERWTETGFIFTTVYAHGRSTRRRLRRRSSAGRSRERCRQRLPSRRTKNDQPTL